MRELISKWAHIAVARVALPVLLALGLFTAGVQAAVDASAFSADEWRRLDAGELVFRSKTRNKGSLRLMGGASWQVIDASPDSVWKALLDTSHYHRMMPQVIEARLVRNKANVRTVFLRQGAKGLFEASYFLKVNVNEERRDITFTVDDQRPHDLLKAAWGFYSVRAYRGGKTLLAYSVMADVDGGPVVGLMRGTMHEWMLRTPSLVKGFVEGSGRRLYR
jgi:ribosome-associated toxin RatA of RatAB toxin-antitoxin module